MCGSRLFPESLHPIVYFQIDEGDRQEALLRLPVAPAMHSLPSVVKSLSMSINGGESASPLPSLEISRPSIHALPPELLSRVFALLSGLNQRDLIALTHVCARWRAVALDCPLLWTHVSVPFRGAEAIIVRSQKVPLHLYLSLHISGMCFQHEDKVSLRRALAEIPRIRELTVCGDRWRIALALGGLVYPAPVLESLTVKSYPQSTSARAYEVNQFIFAGQAPLLRYLCLTDCVLRWDSPLLLGLRSLELNIQRVQPIARVAMSRFAEVLRNMPTLEYLTLRKSAPDVFVSSKALCVPLPCLKRLYLSDSATRVHCLASHLILPPSVRIEYDCTAYHPDDFAELISFLSDQLATPGRPPIRSLELGRGAAPYIRAWQDYDPHTSAFVGDTTFSISFRWVSAKDPHLTARLLVRAASAVPPTLLAALRVMRLRRVDAPTWKTLFAHFQGIRHLCVDACTRGELLQALQPGNYGLSESLRDDSRNRGQLPELETIHLARMTIKSFVNALGARMGKSEAVARMVEILSERRRNGHPIEQQDWTGVNLSAQDLRALRAQVNEFHSSAGG